MTELAVREQGKRASLIERMAQRFEVEPEKLLNTLKSTCFRSDKPITNEQMMALLLVADRYHLDPFTRELFAFDDRRGGIIPYVSIDGWARIINDHPQFDGLDFEYDAAEEAMTCTIYRKDRHHPTSITEYMEECRRNTQPWQTARRRMLRHKALMQCGRIAFGFSLYDQDEAERIRDGGLVERVDASGTQRGHLRQILSAPTTQEAQLKSMAPDTDHAQQQLLREELDESMQASLADLTAELIEADNIDTATEILDRGRSLLPEEEFHRLDEMFQSMFDPH